MLSFASPAPARSAGVTLRSHLAFLFASAAVFLVLFGLLRTALLVYNAEQIGDTPPSVLAEAFFNGLRFDLRVVAYACIPLVLALCSLRAMRARRGLALWLGVLASVATLLGVIELDFYREFHQRLNSLVFQYMSEDPRTVLNMLWYGFPVVRYLLAWAVATWALIVLFRWVERATRPAPGTRGGPAWYWRVAALALCVVLTALAARGTLRQGPPLRWGDAFTTDSMFANQLGLNGILTLYDAAKSRFSSHRDHAWESDLAADEALSVVRARWLTPRDTLVDAERAALRREYQPDPAGRLPVRNVVVILMESFAGRYVGALGASEGITPYFDKLAEEGLLFRRFFSNGTHTHQGMFATMACFPNLPAFEYLMQTPEGGQKFSGLPQLLSVRGYDDLYVYNGDFAWDNQSGFFSNQGMRNFIGRNDYVNPVVSDPTWGVSDQDMFDRAAQELQGRFGGEQAPPFYALLQTLSNHTPYALPDSLPVEAVSGHGSLDMHLTAMRYSDWALGRFFEQARRAPYFKDTLFVIVGDHGFGNNEQLTEMDLVRFNVPLLLIGPGVRDTFGAVSDTVGTQVDVVPTIMGRLGETVRHQCWGRDLLALPAGDAGVGVIKPSGSDQTVAIVEGGRILVKPTDLPSRLYDYRFGAQRGVVRVEDAAQTERLEQQLDAFLATATRSLLGNTAGVADAKSAEKR